MACAAFLGMNAGMKRKRAAFGKYNHPVDLKINLSVFRIVLLLATLGFVFIIADLLFSKNLNLDFTDFSVMRDSFADREATLFAYPGNLLAPFCLIALGSSIAFYEKLPILYRTYGIFIGMALMVFSSLLLAGRSDLVNVFILAGWWLLQRPLFGFGILPKGKLIKIIISLLLILLMVTIVVLSALRSADKELQVIRLLQFNENSLEVSDPVIEMFSNIDPILANGIGEAILYWSHSVVYFDKMFANWDLSPTLVTAFSPFLERRLEALGVIVTGTERWSQWENILSSYGLRPHAFGTAWYQMIISFGRFFGMVVALGVAYMSGKIYAIARMERSFHKLFISSFLFLFFFMWFQSSVFTNPICEWGMIVALLGSNFINKLATAKT